MATFGGHYEVSPGPLPDHNIVREILAVFTGENDATEWFADMGNKKPSGLGEMPLTYDPPLKAGEELSFVRQDYPTPASGTSGRYFLPGPKYHVGQYFARRLRRAAKTP